MSCSKNTSALRDMQYGEDAAKESGQGGGGGGGMADIFDLFGGGGGRRAAPRERRGEDVLHRLKVTLEELYNGGTRWDFALTMTRPL
jgi:DnaJ family protein A protein 2